LTSYDHIIDKIFVGPFPDNFPIECGKEDVFINLSRQSIGAHPSLIMYHFPFCYWEYKEFETAFKLIDKIIGIIEKSLMAENRVYINCRLGIDRAGIISICYMISKGFSSEEATKLFLSKRKCRPILADTQAMINSYFNYVSNKNRL
jgi:hypothetical protein